VLIKGDDYDKPPYYKDNPGKTNPYAFLTACVKILQRP
jgi:hypothetical protein